MKLRTTFSLNMKPTSLITMLVAGILFSGNVNARESYSDAEHHVDNLNNLASELISDYQNQLREWHHGHRISADEADLLNSLFSLKTATSRLHHESECSASPYRLRESFNGVRAAFRRVEHEADEADARGIHREIERFEETLGCLERTGFEREEEHEHEHESHYRGHEEHEHGPLDIIREIHRRLHD